jgi:Ala-tRNA(Pro) deacylase
MPPFGNLYGLPVYVESNLTKQETIVFPVGISTDTMSLRYSDFARLAQPTVIDFASTYSLA